MIYAVVHDDVGNISSLVRSDHGPTLLGYLDQPNVLFIETEEQLFPEDWKVDLDKKELTRRPPEPDIPQDLEEAKAVLLAKIDNEAEKVRMTLLTPGIGQLYEYQETEKEAAELLASTNPQPGQHKMLRAELEAREEAGETGLNLRKVARDVIDAADASRNALAAIKKKRRRAKLLVQQAGSLLEAKEAARINWQL